MRSLPPLSVRSLMKSQVQTWLPETADYVMYWWQHAADLAVAGKIRRFGFITTNSITQTFNRQVVQAALGRDLGLIFAIPDHPWVDSTDGASVRIAMTVGKVHAAEGTLLTVTQEKPAEGDGAAEVTLQTQQGHIYADLSCGADVALNTLRAAEEKGGTIRWLRPVLQNPTAASQQQVEIDLAVGAGDQTSAKKTKAVRPAWPTRLPDRIRALQMALGALPDHERGRRRMEEGGGSPRSSLRPPTCNCFALWQGRQPRHHGVRERVVT